MEGAILLPPLHCLLCKAFCILGFGLASWDPMSTIPIETARYRATIENESLVHAKPQTIHSLKTRARSTAINLLKVMMMRRESRYKLSRIGRQSSRRVNQSDDKIERIPRSLAVRTPAIVVSTRISLAYRHIRRRVLRLVVRSSPEPVLRVRMSEVRNCRRQVRDRIVEVCYASHNSEL
jgi:hypothetical protein